MMVENIFWFMFVILVYVYFGYLFLLSFLNMFRKKQSNKREIEAKVSLIISAYNEEKHIKSKIEHCLHLDYPINCLEIIVVSDASTDKTDDIVSSFKNKGVKLLRVEGRLGKTASQNEAAKFAKGEILVFTDATTTYNKDMIRKIVKNFADHNVGCVGGELVYLNKSGTGTAEGGGLYWDYEKRVKQLESNICSLIGVSGCLYAVRKSLYEDIPVEQISDFIIAQLIYKKGYKSVYEPEAISFEDLLGENKQEFNMRVRVALRSLHGLRYMRAMLNPMKYGFYSIQLISHKVLRYAAPIFLIAIFVTNLFLLQDGFFAKFLYLQLGFYILALIGRVSASTNKLFYGPYYFCLVNLAALCAIIKFMQGEKQITWETVR